MLLAGGITFLVTKWLVTSGLNTAFGHRRYLYFAALLYFYASHHHFSFLISSFSFN